MLPAEPMSQVEADRLASLKFCGVWQTLDGEYAVFDDRSGSGSSFMLAVGETVGEGLRRLTDRYGARSQGE